MREHRRLRPATGLPVLVALIVAGVALPAVPAYAAETDTVVAMVNEERESAGCSPVTVDSRLTAAARDHSEDQAERQVMTHTGADGSTSGQRATRAGYRWSKVGENVARGTTSGQRVMTLWMESSAHRANILNCQFEHIGMGLVDGYWTQVFAKPR